MREPTELYGYNVMYDSLRADKLHNVKKYAPKH